MASSIPAVKAALLARLKADTALSGVQVTWGHPHPEAMESELVTIGDVTRRSLAYTAALTQATEDYEFGVLVSCEVSAETSVAGVAPRVWELVDAVIANIVAWNAAGYGDTGAVAILPGEATEAEMVDGSAREVSVTLSVEVKARI